MWKVIVTVGTLGAVAGLSIAVGFYEGAYLCIGALAGYLGKLNGAK